MAVEPRMTKFTVKTVLRFTVLGVPEIPHVS